MLDTVADDVWVATQPVRFLGVETGTRMTIVRLPDGALFVHSPIALRGGIGEAVDALGPVRAVVAPSLFHHLSVGEWMHAYPEASFFPCPGLALKRKDLAWTRVLSDEAEPEWRGELDQVWFRARTMEDEVVFFHRASGTMICADMIFNLSTHSSRLTRIVARLLGNTRPGATWLEHVMIRRRGEAREQLTRMLAWEPERIVLAHGDLVPSGGAEVLRRAYAWLL